MTVYAGKGVTRLRVDIQLRVKYNLVMFSVQKAVTYIVHAYRII